MLLASTLVLLTTSTACVKRAAPPPPVIVVKPTLIEIPADLRACVETSGVRIPKGPLTVAQVVALWKDDRIRIVILRNCARRALAFYDAQRKRLQK